jgi:uncharacterized membrane protein
MQVKFRKALVVVLAVSMVVCGFSACNRGKTKKANRDSELNQRKPEIADQDLIIQIADITRNALFFPVVIDGKQMEVLAVMTPDGIIRTAFNACQVCYKKGQGYYVQVETVLVCQRCKKRYRMEVIETKTGGCNPVSIFSENKIVTDSAITISKEYLTQAKALFESWENSK